MMRQLGLLLLSVGLAAGQKLRNVAVTMTDTFRSFCPAAKPTDSSSKPKYRSILAESAEERQRPGGF